MVLHFKFSPSGAHRWMNCPGSIAACAGLPDTTNAYAEEGTLAHVVAAALLEGRAPPECAGDMLEHCQNYGAFVADQRGKGSTLAVEKQVELKDIPDFGGTIDALIYNPRDQELIVDDLKYGKGVPVFAENNSQLLCYGVLAAGLFPDVKTVKLVIYQPRSPGDAIRMDHSTPKALAAFRDGTLLPAIARCNTHDAPRCAGTWCRWCKVHATCQEARGAVEAGALVALQSVPIGKATPPDPKTLTPEQMAKVLDFSAVLNAWVGAVEGEALLRLQKGERIEGRKLVRKGTHRRWQNIMDAQDTLQGMLGADAWKEPELISPAQAEKLAKGKDAKKAVAALAYYPEGALTIAAEADKRMAVLPAQVAQAALEADDDYLR